MPSTLSRLLERNREWVAERTADDPEYFTRQAAKHEPHYLWIGCSDARVPANVVTRTEAGEMFVHRNVANVVVPTDNNLLAVLQFAIEVLHVHDVIVCGHEGCGGVRAAMGETSLSLNTRNFEAAIESFGTLVDDLAAGTLQATSQDPAAPRRTYSRHDRPDAMTVLDWRRPAVELDRLVRALTFGPYPNPLGVAKLVAGAHVSVGWASQDCLALDLMEA